MRETHYRVDPNHDYVHIALDASMLKLGLCGAVTGVETRVVGARICLDCVAWDLEHQLHWVRDQLREYGPGGPPVKEEDDVEGRWDFQEGQQVDRSGQLRRGRPKWWRRQRAQQS